MSKYADIKHLKLSEHYSVRPCGLQNTGVICYFNSMLQCLLSCTSFVQLFRTNEEINSRNELCKRLYELMQYDGEQPYPSAQVWMAFIQQLRLRKMLPPQFSGQNDVQESLTLFLDCLNSPEIDTLFESRYSHSIYCLECKRSTSYKILNEGTERETREDRIDENFFIALQKSEIGEDFVRGLRTQIKPLGDDDLKCTLCTKRGKKFERKELIMVPEIIIVVFKKYINVKENGRWTTKYQNWTAEFPDTFSIGSFNYRLIAQNEHSGSMGSGHYWAKIRRAGKTLEANDTQLRNSEMGPTSNTYMAWYHII